MNNRFYSNGKLLITGEYAVLDGARAFAIPLRFGQSMEVYEGDSNDLLCWNIADKNGEWFRCKLQLPALEIVSCTNEKMGQTLQKWLYAARKLNPDFLINRESIRVECQLNFDRNWGWGSSSTALTNLAKWARVDAFQLNRMVSSGSGYDIACASHDKPIIYQLQKGIQSVEEIDFTPSYANYLYLVWLGKKKNTTESILSYHKDKHQLPTFIDEISALTDRIAFAKNYEEFVTCMNLHKTLMSMMLQTPSAQEKCFPDFSGNVKYLGAWGGDFILAASTKPECEVRRYFKSKQMPLVYKWNELIKI